MANRYCKPVTEIPEYLIKRVLAPSGGLQAGDVVFLDTLASATDLGMASSRNYSVYTATQPATANLGRKMAIVINGGFETLSDGRRPEGQPDYTQYTYLEGEVATAIILQEGAEFEISFDAVTGTPAVGQSLHPVNASNDLAVAASTPTGTYSAFDVKALKNLRAGGRFGAQFLSTVVAMVKEPTA